MYISRSINDLGAFMSARREPNREMNGNSRHLEEIVSSGGREGFVYTKIVSRRFRLHLTRRIATGSTLRGKVRTPGNPVMATDTAEPATRQRHSPDPTRNAWQIPLFLVGAGGVRRRLAGLAAARHARPGRGLRPRPHGAAELVREGLARPRGVEGPPGARRGPRRCVPGTRRDGRGSPSARATRGSPN